MSCQTRRGFRPRSWNWTANRRWNLNSFISFGPPSSFSFFVASGNHDLDRVSLSMISVPFFRMPRAAAHVCVLLPLVLVLFFPPLLMFCRCHSGLHFVFPRQHITTAYVIFAPAPASIRHYTSHFTLLSLFFFFVITYFVGKHWMSWSRYLAFYIVSRHF